MQALTLKITGMMCGHCQNHVKKAFEEVFGVEEVEVDLENGLAKIIFNEKLVNNKVLSDALQNTNYSVA